jgi:hypothetical protein
MTTHGSIKSLARAFAGARTLIIPALALTLALGCSKSATRSDDATAGADAKVRTVRLGDTVAVRRGESVVFGNEIFITFNRVSEDSRCPEDVKCVWAGNARVELSMRKSGGHALPIVLNTGIVPRDTMIDRYHVALHALAPATNSKRVIGPDEYVASISVSRR